MCFRRNHIFLFIVSFIPFFVFLFLVTYGEEVTKIQKYYVIFVYTLQGKMGKTGKNWTENHATKVTKIPKNKRQKYGMSKTLVFMNNTVCKYVGLIDPL